MDRRRRGGHRAGGVGQEATFSWSLYCLKRGGTLVIIGYDPQRPLTVNSKEMHYNEWRIAGTRAATKQDLLELIALTERGQLKPVVAKILPLSLVNEGLAEVRSGAQVGRVGSGWSEREASSPSVVDKAAVGANIFV